MMRRPEARMLSVKFVSHFRFFLFEQEQPLAINTSRIVKSDIFLDFFYGVIRAYCRTFRITRHQRCALAGLPAKRRLLIVLLLASAGFSHVGVYSEIS